MGKTVCVVVGAKYVNNLLSGLQLISWRLCNFLGVYGETGGWIY